MGIPRSGSASLAHALGVLGYRPFFYCPLTEQGLDWLLQDDLAQYDALVDWSLAGEVEAATEAFLPSQIIFMARQAGWEHSLDNLGVQHLAPDYMADFQFALDFVQKSTKIPYVVLDINRNPRWNELCIFLGKPIPEIPFPHLNKSNFNYKI